MLHRLSKRVAVVLRDQRGLTLPELLVSIAILSIVAGFVGATMFQSTKIHSEVLNDGIATNELRNALSIFARDVKSTQSSDLVDSVPASSVVLSWIDEYNDIITPHSSSYAITDSKLIRTYDGTSTVVARGVVSVSFELTGELITITLEVNSDNGGTTTLSLSTLMKTVGTS